MDSHSNIRHMVVIYFGGMYIMKVKYVNHMGNDLSVVNSARVSFGKRSVEEGYDQIDIDGYQTTIHILVVRTVI